MATVQIDRWACWHHTAAIAALIVVADDGTRHCWRNERIVTDAHRPLIDHWADTHADEPFAWLPESALTA